MMRHLAIMLLVASCAQVDPSTYRTLDSYYARHDGWRLDADKNIVQISNGSATGFEVSTAGVLSATSAELTADLTVPGDLNLSGGDGNDLIVSGGSDLDFTNSNVDIEYRANSSVHNDTFIIAQDTFGTVMGFEGHTSLPVVSAYTLFRVDKVTADPCGAHPEYTEGSVFYNDTDNYWCGCDGTNDVQLHDPDTACFAEE